jgi:hypothetical protein
MGIMDHLRLWQLDVFAILTMMISKLTPLLVLIQLNMVAK